MIHRRVVLIPIVVSLAVLSTADASRAWGRNGHRVVCEIAYQRLSPEGRALVQDLQRGESQRFHETCLWADKVKKSTRADTYNYHFVNIPAGVRGLDMERDCPTGDCIVWAIEHFREVLVDRSRPLQARNEALKFLGHFVADIHQPLHAGRPEDRGGNDIDACFFGDCGHPSEPLDLHKIWDTNLLEHGYRDWRILAAELHAATSEAEAEAWRSLDPVLWTDESYRLAEDFAYPRLPAGGVGETYYRPAIGIVKKRLQQAGVRLAYLLDTLASPAREPVDTAASERPGASWKRLQPPADLPRDRPLRAGFLILDGVYNTELTAPYDIFHHTVFHTDPGMEVFTVSPDGRPVTSFEGLEIAAHYSFETAPPIDVLVVPSAEHNMDTDLENEELIAWVRATGEKALFLVSLCDGAFVLAAAGLLDGHACTTFPGDQDRFAEMFPGLDLRRGVSFVHDGKALTSQGGARSFDVAMYLADHLYGEKAARGIGRGMVIDWPPAPETLTALVVERKAPPPPQGSLAGD